MIFFKLFTKDISKKNEYNGNGQSNEPEELINTLGSQLNKYILNEKFDCKSQTKNMLNNYYSSIKYEYNSLINYPIFEDNLWGGIYAFTINLDKPYVFPVMEWFIKYSEAVNAIICLNINYKKSHLMDKKEFLLKKIGLGFRLLFFVVGKGDGYYRAFLSDEILKETWLCFSIKSLLGLCNQFFLTGYIIGFFLNYLDKLYISIGHYSHKALHISVHYLSELIFVAFYILLPQFKFSLNCSFFYQTIFCFSSFDIKNKLFSVISFNPIKLFLTLLKANNIISLLNPNIKILLNTKIKTNKNTKKFYIMFIVNIGMFQFIIFYNSKGNFNIIISAKTSESTSVLNLLNIQEKQISYNNIG